MMRLGQLFRQNIGPRECTCCRMASGAAIPQPRHGSLLGGQDTLLIQNKVYMTVTMRDISVLDLNTSSFSTVQLPDGVQHPASDFMLSCTPDGSSIYLVELKDFQLCIWIYKGGCWSIADTILLVMCAGLMISDCTIEDAHSSSPWIKHVGDHAEFVLLQMGRHVRYLDTRCRTDRKSVV